MKFNNEFFKDKINVTLILSLCIGIIFDISVSVRAMYPDGWNLYTRGSGLPSTIYSNQKSTMDNYNSSLTFVPTTSEIEDFKAFGTNNEYTPLTIEGGKISKWYASGYGPFIKYAETNSAEATSIRFNNDANLWNNSRYVYVSAYGADLSDSKSIAMLSYDRGESTNLSPLLINSAYSGISSTIMNEIKAHNKKNAIVAGGSQRFDTLFAIGKDLNVVRIGGKDRNYTARYLQVAENASNEIYVVSSPPDFNAEGYIYEDKGATLSSLSKDKIKSHLKNRNFELAIYEALREKMYGALAYARDGEPILTIGCKNINSDTKFKVLKVYIVDQSAGFDYGIYQYIGDEYRYASRPLPPDPPQPPVDNAPPTADVNAQSIAVVGDDVYVSGNGYSNDKSVTSLKASVNVNGGPVKVNDAPITGELTTFDADSANKKTSVGGVVWFSEEGTYKARTTATDSNYRSGFSNEVPILVIPPYPVVNVYTKGSLKENRKIVIDATSSTGGSKRNKVVWEKTKWEVSAVSGNASDIRIQKHTEGSTNGEILLDSSRGINKSLDGLSMFDMSFKKPGTYTLTCTLTNDYKEGKTTTKDITINVEPDIPPVANFGMPTYITRNPNSTNSNGFSQATQTITDTETEENGSYSKDEDIVSDRAWLISFDSNNDENLEDEKWYIWNESTSKWVYLGNYTAAKNYNFTTIHGNRKSVDFSATHVGNYEVGLKVREKFGQEFIPQFVTDNDRRTNSTFN